MQTYLRTLVAMDGKMTVNNLPFDDIEKRVTCECVTSNRMDLIDLALALAKYDFSEAPSNWHTEEWDPDHRSPPHEKIILQWVDWCVKEKEYKSEIKQLIKDYKKG